MTTSAIGLYDPRRESSACGVGFITHGSSDAHAIDNAVRRVESAARAHFTDEIAQAVAPSEALLAGVDALTNAEGARPAPALPRA